MRAEQLKGGTKIEKSKLQYGTYFCGKKTSRQVIWGGSREFRPWTLSAELLSGRRWARERAAAPEVSELAVRSAGWERGGGEFIHNTTVHRRQPDGDESTETAERGAVLWGEVRTAQHVVARPALIAIARPWLIGQATSRRPAGRLLARHTTRAEQAVWLWRQVSVSSGAFTYKVSIN